MHIAIIGNGIAGISAARHLRKLSDHKITVISGETDYFFSRTALMYVYMGHMRWDDIEPYEEWFWKKNRIDLKQGWVEKVDTKGKQLEFIDGEKMVFDKLIIASGSKPNKFGWPGQDLDGVHGLYSRQDLESLERHSEKGIHQAVIVGGGLIGIELAEMLHSRHIPVTFLVRENRYWNAVLPNEESDMITRHIREHGIDLRLETELKEIWGTQEGTAQMVVTSTGEKIKCNYVGLTAGVSPNIDFIRFGDIEIKRGILVDENLQTNIPDIYAIGDCAELRNPREGRRGIEAIWYTGRMMGETVAYNICDKKIAYNPGIWFNSAKFLDIEYQVYGNVNTRPPENHTSIYWEHADGQKAIRIVYDNQTSEVLGFNLMGVRYRHEVCEKWLKEKTHIEKVLQNLGIANFDPEFYKEYEEEVIKIYNQQTGKNLQLKQKRSLKGAMQFLRNLATT
ncbi:MAG: NADPH-dependent 2,4-dienoyl-CoA reductase/sulfur reductase-like enzyme [Paraglaciecola sp.]|jgi:NADPH-dependent 2,4-dienoyl-CoA reductase/sulfur reductase-like enzyme